MSVRITRSVASLLLVCLSACNRSDQDNKKGIVPDSNKPFVFIYHSSAYPLPDKPLESGVVAAVWNDGTVIRASAGKPLGTSYVKGKWEQSGVVNLRRAIEESGLLSNEKPSALVVDAASEHLILRTDDHLNSWAHSPAHGENPKITHIKNLMLGWPLIKQSILTNHSQYAGYPHAWYE